MTHLAAAVQLLLLQLGQASKCCRGSVGLLRRVFLDPVLQVCGRFDARSDTPRTTQLQQVCL
jgi:hypothetical protein